MSAHASPLPRSSFIAVVSVLGGVMLCAAAARFSGFAAPPAPPPVLASVNLSFADTTNGAVAVRDTDTGRLVSTVPARDGGFLRSTMRVLATERAAENLGQEKPFTLAALQGGRMTLTDTATGQVLELEAFGPTNEGAFAKLLNEDEAGK
jgi:putative photosynthetic complex assembly protein